MSDETEHPAGDESAGCAGPAVLSVLVLGALWGLYLVSPTVFILGAWAFGWGSIVWAAHRPVPGTPNPAPPLAPEGAVEEEPQFKVVEDSERGSRSVVVWDDKKAGTT